MNERTKQGPARAARASDPLDTVMRYHQETKHHFSHYARSLGYLDWANQPDPFRRYEGSPLFALPRLKPEDAPVSPLYEDLYRPGAIASAPHQRSQPVALVRIFAGHFGLEAGR